MKDDNVTAFDPSKRLADAIREVKNAAADRSDVIIEMREAERMRLELLAAELAPIIAEVPEDADLFDFAISSGLQPRFWIDAVAHVAMGRDKRTFRFLKDTRLGRVVLAESTDLKTVANAVTRYLAERIVEQQRLMEGDVATYGKPSPASAGAAGKPIETPVQQTQAATSETGSEPALASIAEATAATPPPASQKGFMGGLLLTIAGAVVGLAVAAAVYWDKLGVAELLKGAS